MQSLQPTQGVSLRKVFPDGRIYGGHDIRISSCCADPYGCRLGDLFVAVESPDLDGHDLVSEAVRRGAKAILAERQLPVDAPICIVPDTREAYGRLCQTLAGYPSQQLRTIGVSGTNGKTTTSMLIASVLKAAKQRTGVLNTIAYHDGSECAPAARTTPGASELAYWMSRMRAAGCVNAVLEVSSQALAQKRTAGVELDAAVLTNVRRDHLDFHGNIFNYRQAKARLFQHLKPHGFAVVNADDPASKFLLRRLECPVLTVGMRMPAELTASVVERYACEQTILLSAGNETAAVQTRMFGDHHVYNCLAAAAVGLVLGLDLTTVARGLESLDRVPGRLEPIACGQPFGVYVDYARTPDTLAVSLRTLRQVTSGRVICVFGADADGDPSQRPLLGRVVERSADLGIITGDNPRWDPPLEIAHDIIDGYRRPAKAHVLPDRSEAIRWALGEAKPDDAVLIAGKGDQGIQVVGDEEQCFDDCEVARKWLYEVGAQIEYEQEPRRVIPMNREVQFAN